MKSYKRTKATDLAILAAIVIACAIPFLSQPFHMDDNFYMDMARNAQAKPFFPNDTPYVFQGIGWPDLGSHTHPLFQTYFLATILHFFGEGPGTEWIYHFFALIYPIIAVLSFYFICARLLDRPLWPAALFAVSPLFLVMQHTMMTDVPMLAFWLASVACFLYAMNQTKSGLYILSGVFLTAAMFTGYQSFALIPLLGFYCWRQKCGRKGWAALVVPPALIFLWFVITCIHFKRFLFGFTLGYAATRQPFSLHTLGVKLFSIFEYQGWLLVFPFFVFCLLARQLKWRVLPLILLGTAILTQFSVPEYRMSDKCIFLIGFAASFFMVLEMGRIAWSSIVRRRSILDFGVIEEQFLGLWYFGFLLFCLVGMTEGSARYILPLLPPFLICYCRRLEMAEITEYRIPAQFLNSAMLASGSFVLSLAWGLAVSFADNQFAKIYPRAAKDISRITDKTESYSVGEWGFRYYLGRAGIQPMPVDETKIRGGSFIAIPKLAVPYDIPSGLRSIMMPIHTFRYSTRSPLRILDWQTPAGFYSTGWGLLPFSFSQGSLEEIELYQVNLMAGQLPFAQIDSRSGIKPWPGYVKGAGKALLAILSNPGTRITYPFDLPSAAQLHLLCGISSDSCEEGSETSYSFDVRQMSSERMVLSESHITLKPGIKNEDKELQPLIISLKKAGKGFLEFTYSQSGGGPGCTGAFAESVLRPIN